MAKLQLDVIHGQRMVDGIQQCPHQSLGPFQFKARENTKKGHQKLGEI